MTLGLTIKRPETVSKEDNSFQSPRPELPLSEDQLRLNHVTPPDVDHTPAEPVIEKSIDHAKNINNNRLAELLAKAELAAKEQAKIIERAHRISTNDPVRSRKVTNTNVAPKVSEPQVLITDADKCDDETFIKRAMGQDIHQPEMKRLFYANGGQTYIDTGLLYAQAFDMLRRAKKTAINIKNNIFKVNKDEPFSRNHNPGQNCRTYVAGLPTDEERYRRAFAQEDAKRRKETEMWLQQN